MFLYLSIKLFMFIHYEVKVAALQSDNIFPNLTQILSFYLPQLWRDRIYVISTEVLFCLRFCQHGTTYIHLERENFKWRKVDRPMCVTSRNFLPEWLVLANSAHCGQCHLGLALFLASLNDGLLPGSRCWNKTSSNM